MHFRSLFKGADVVASNDDWTLSDTARLTVVFDRAGAFHFPSADKDAALFITLDPGAYTVQVAGLNGATGSFLAEVYEVR